MRDLLVIALVLLGAGAALRRPWVGVMLWTWLSIMNPHRFAWGWAYDAPLAAIAALGHVMGDAGKHETGEAGHGDWLARASADVC